MRKILNLVCLMLIFCFHCSFFIPQSGHLYDEKIKLTNNQSFSTEDMIITDTLDSLKTLMDQYSTDCYGMELSFSGYENVSQENWYFDSVGILCGYQLNWNLEGTSGEEFYWFNKGKLSYVYAEKYGQEDEPEIIFLNNKSNQGLINIYQTDINAREKRVFQMIKNNVQNINEDEEILIQIEETKNYGFDFIEKTEISIDKTLFKQLFKE